MICTISDISLHFFLLGTDMLLLSIRKINFLGCFNPIVLGHSGSSGQNLTNVSTLENSTSLLAAKY